MTNDRKSFDELREELMAMAKPIAEDVRETVRHNAPRLSREVQREIERIVRDASRDARESVPRFADRVAATAPKIAGGLLAATPFVARRASRPMFGGVVGIALALAAGAAVMYFLDPDRGEERRRWGGMKASERAELPGDMRSEETYG